MAKTSISSFVVRFTQEKAPGDLLGLSWRGTVRHVQSDAQVRFTDPDQAWRFMMTVLEMAGQEEYEPNRDE